MRRKLMLAAALAGSLLVWAAPPAVAGTVTAEATLESSLLTRINQVRKNHGLRRLKQIPRLTKAADRHAGSMAAANYFRHELYTPARPLNWTPFGKWIRWFYPGPGYSSWTAGENLAWGAPDISARQTVKRWLASPGHRANLLARRWRHVGLAAVHVEGPVGYFRSWDDVTIVVAEFGRRS